VTTNGEMTPNANTPEMGGHTTKLGKEVLKDERKANDERRSGTQPRCNLLGPIADVNHFHRAAMLLEHGRKVSHPKIALVLIPNEGNIDTTAPSVARVSV
jgi:hypothetical protein